MLINIPYILAKLGFTPNVSFLSFIFNFMSMSIFLHLYKYTTYVLHDITYDSSFGAEVTDLWAAVYMLEPESVLLTTGLSLQPQNFNFKAQPTDA